MFSNTSTGTNPYTTYIWAFGDGGTSTSNSPTHTYMNYTYSATLMASDASYTPACVSNKIVTLAVTSCAANAGFRMSPIGTPLVWDAFPFSPNNVSASTWSWGDGSFTDSLYTSHVYASTGSYFICLSMTVTFGATDSSCMTFAIYRTVHTAQDMNMIQINVINPSTPLGIKNTSLENAAFVLSPNPNNGSFLLNVIGLGNGSSLVSIDNAMGELVYRAEQETHNNNLVKDIQLNQVAKGVYFIKINSKGQNLTKKMITADN